MVGALGVVEHQPVGEFPVEEGEVSEEQVYASTHLWHSGWSWRRKNPGEDRAQGMAW